MHLELDSSWKIKVKSCRRDMLKRGTCVVHGCVSAVGLNLRQRSSQHTLPSSFRTICGFMARYARTFGKTLQKPVTCKLPSYNITSKLSELILIQIERGKFVLSLADDGRDE